MTETHGIEPSSPNAVAAWLEGKYEFPVLPDARPPALAANIDMTPPDRDVMEDLIDMLGYDMSMFPQVEGGEDFAPMSDWG